MTDRRTAGALLQPIAQRLYAVLRRCRRFLPRRGRDVRAMVLDPQGRLLLVRHAYLPGWCLPGGVAKRGEADEDAVRRELREETGIGGSSRVELFARYVDHEGRPVTTVLVVRLAERPPELRLAPLEIAETRFVDLRQEALPDGTSPATRARIREHLGLDPLSPLWLPGGARAAD